MRSGSSDSTNAFASSSSSRIRFRAGAAGQHVRELAVDPIEQGGAQQQILDVGRLALQHLRDQVLRDHAVAAGELGDEPLRVGVAGQRERREPQARGPPLRPLVQQRYSGVGQRDPRGPQQLAGLALGEAQVRRADLGQLARQAQLMQPQPQIVARGQDRVHVRRKVHQQPAQLSERLRRTQLVQIIDNQRDAAAGVGELRQHPVDHRRRVEVGRRRLRFRTAAAAEACRTASSSASQKLLGVLLVALHPQHGEPVPLPRTVGPGAQQRRLPAAGRSRDDRHLACRRAVQGSEKITPVDQPGSRLIHRQRPALLTMSDT